MAMLALLGYSPDSFHLLPLGEGVLHDWDITRSLLDGSCHYS